jgi:hypothetical protein
MIGSYAGNEWLIVIPLMILCRVSASIDQLDPVLSRFLVDECAATN